MKTLLFVSLSLVGHIWAQEPMNVAGGVVRSKEWIVRRGKIRQEEFKGDVRYSSRLHKLNSDWALFEHAEQKWTARGNVRLTRTLADGSLLEAIGETAHHNQKTGYGDLEPAPGRLLQFKRTIPHEPSDYVQSGAMAWDEQKHVTLKSGVKIWGARVEAAADQADYEHELNVVTFTGGRPVVRKLFGDWTAAMKADRIIGNDAPQRLEGRGRAQGWIVFSEQFMSRNKKQ